MSHEVEGEGAKVTAEEAKGERGSGGEVAQAARGRVGEGRVAKSS